MESAQDPMVRLHELLLGALRQRRGVDPHATPVTVAEIYQDLAPYRNVRAALGVEMNADYEFTLLRLLSGEGNLARIEPAAAREQIAHELESPNPNVALYRKYAGCDVWLLATGSSTPAWVSDHLAEAAPVQPALAPTQPAAAPLLPWEEVGITAVEAEIAEAEPEVAGEPAVQWQDEVETSPEVMVVMAAEPQPELLLDMDSETPEEPAAAAAPTMHAAAPVGARCAFCDSALPRGRTVRYCPYCGQDQTQQPCPACGEAVESGWSFCVACGEPAPNAVA